MRARVFVVAAIISVIVGVAIWKAKEARSIEASKAPIVVAARLPPSAPVPATSQAPTVPVRPATSGATSKPTSYGSERDLWSFAHEAAAAGGNGNAYEALSAVTVCQQFIATAPQLAAFLDGGKTAMQGPRTPEREQAIAEMKLRCSGFEQNSAEAGKFAKELKSNLAGTPFVTGAKTIPKEQLRELLSSDAPDAVAMAAMHLLAPWQRALNIPDNDPREDDLAVALALSRCDLGSDCTVNGSQSLDQCIYSGICGQDVRDVLSTAGDQQTVARINGYRQQIVEGIRNRNWAAIGL